MPVAHLVLFVADAAGDEHADALRDAARSVPGAGFFDDPGGGDQRTVGAYLRTDDLRAGVPLVAAVARVSAELQVRIEVQFREQILGWIRAGEPDPELAVRGLTAPDADPAARRPVE
ncbi:MAG TPA: hypothetical protein VFT50_04130 [Baekduia sp.]|nr:hypothetical protein [Baekduia sp.]